MLLRCLSSGPGHPAPCACLAKPPAPSQQPSPTPRRHKQPHAYMHYMQIMHAGEKHSWARGGRDLHPSLEGSGLPLCPIPVRLAAPASDVWRVHARTPAAWLPCWRAEQPRQRRVCVSQPQPAHCLLACLLACLQIRLRGAPSQQVHWQRSNELPKPHCGNTGQGAHAALCCACCAVLSPAHRPRVLRLKPAAVAPTRLLPAFCLPHHAGMCCVPAPGPPSPPCNMPPCVNCRPSPLSAPSLTTSGPRPSMCASTPAPAMSRRAGWRASPLHSNGSPTTAITW